MNCPSCGVGLSKKESEDGCPLCDWTPQRQARLETRKAVARPQVASVRDQIEQHPVYGFADRLARWLVEQYRDEVPNWTKNPIAWRNRQGSSHTRYDGKLHQIVFGYQSVMLTHDSKFMEYKTWRWLWDGMHDGLKGVWQEVLHEFAHALQAERNGRNPGKAHTMVWANAVRELQTLVPFEDALEITKGE